jgi:hypothetical protein
MLPHPGNSSRHGLPRQLLAMHDSYEENRVTNKREKIDSTDVTGLGLLIEKQFARDLWALIASNLRRSAYPESNKLIRCNPLPAGTLPQRLQSPFVQ